MRSATWDAMAEGPGFGDRTFAALYHELNTGGIGLIVTGFAFVSFPLGQAGTGQYAFTTNKMIPHGNDNQRGHDHSSRIGLQIATAVSIP